jgi:hypothetical protein
MRNRLDSAAAFNISTIVSSATCIKPLSSKTYKHIFMSIFPRTQSQMSLAGKKTPLACSAPSTLRAPLEDREAENV